MKNITKFEAEVITEYHPLFKSLLWVSIARSKDDDRFILQHLHVERNGIDYHIVATDGKRLHVGTFAPGMFDDDISEIEPGEYEVIARNAKKIVLARADDAGDYPNWKQLMPEEIPVMREVVTRASISRLGIRSGVLLATDFVLDACGFGNGFGKNDSVHVEFASERPGGPFLIQHELGKAIVMPLRMENGADADKSDTEATPEIDGLATKKEATTDEDDDGPRIVDKEEDEEPLGPIGYRELAQYEISALLTTFEGVPKLQRKKRLAQLLEIHGPDNIRKFDEYRTWNGADLHVAKVIQECINSLPELPEDPQPEGADADY